MNKEKNTMRRGMPLSKQHSGSLTKLLIKPLLLLSVLVLCMSFCTNIYAAETEEEKQSDPNIKTYTIQLFAEPQFIKLPKANTSYWFQVPANTDIQKASLSLILQTSDTLLEDYSTATVEVNGVAIASINLQELKDTVGEKWDVEIPVDRLKTDGSLNQLSIITAQRSILGDCADIDNPSNWLIIGEDSAMYLTLRHSDSYSLNELYPFLLNKAELGNTLNAELVLARKDVDAEAGAALTIASAMGANYPNKTIERLDFASQRSGEAENSFLINADAGINDGEGYLEIGNDNGATIQVSGGKKEGLDKAVRVLSDSQLLSQFSTDKSTIKSTYDPIGGALASREDGHYTLEDFGYDDMNLEGAFHQKTYFSIRQPDGVLGGPDSYFEVHFRHSDALVSDTSMLTVYFDGVPASSIQLSRTNVEDGKLKVTIPREVLDKGSFEITVDVYNYLGKIDCSKDWYDVAWTVIGKDSVVYLEPTDNTLYPSLEHFPALWGNDIMVCLPENASDKVWQSMAAFSARNGQNTQLISSYKVVHAINAEEAAGSHIIIAGARNEINLPAEIVDELYIRPEANSYSVKEGVATIPEALEDKIIIQAVRSPFDYKKIVYVIMWADASQEDNLVELALNKEDLNSMGGEISLIKGNNIVSLDPETEKADAIPLSPEVLMERIIRVTGIPRAGLFVIAALIVVIIVLIIRSIMEKNRFAKAKQKMEIQNKMQIEEELAKESMAESGEGVARTDKGDKSEKSDKSDESGKNDNSDKTEDSSKSAKSDKAGESGESDKSDKSDESDKTDKSGKLDKSKKSGKK